MLLKNFLDLFVESAPWLMMGLFVAGLMKAFLPQQWLAAHLGKSGFGSAVKAAFLGAPLPLCSCGVVPAALSLRRNGASKSATTAFLISTPETGVDSISISYVLLGPFMAFIRPVAAIVTAIVAGSLVGREDTLEEKRSLENSVNSEPSCCESKKLKEEQERKKLAESDSSCCSAASAADKDHASDHADAPVPKESVSTRVKESLRFTFVNLIQDISLWLLLGLAFAALVKTFVPTDFLLQWGDGLMSFIIMAVIGVPMYICAVASTPIAAGLLLAGLSPGAVLVFMLVGPATNIGTMGIVKAELGTRALLAYLGSVVGVGFVFGYICNYLANIWGVDAVAQVKHVHDAMDSPLAVIMAVVLAVIIAHGLWDKYKPQQTQA